MEKIDLSKLSVADLKKALESAEKSELQQRDKERKNYEKDRDELIEYFISEAREAHRVLKRFKDELHEKMELQHQRLQDYGAIRANSKGGFSIMHNSKGFKVTRTRSTTPKWDERSDKAVALISDFLKDTIKKRDLDTFEILWGFLQKNENGDLEYSKVMDLLSHQKRYNDARWEEGLNLIRESYSLNFRGYGYDLFEMDSEGKWQRIDINFSSL